MNVERMEQTTQNKFNDMINHVISCTLLLDTSKKQDERQTTNDEWMNDERMNDQHRHETIIAISANSTDYIVLRIT